MTGIKGWPLSKQTSTCALLLKTSITCTNKPAAATSYICTEKVRSSRYENLIYDVSPDHIDTHIGDLCEKGYQLRPHIVWFGEAVPLIEPAIEEVEKADIFVVIGTSLNVYPAAGLLRYVPRNVPVFLIDPNPVNDASGRVTHVIQKGAGEGVKELTKILKAGL